MSGAADPDARAMTRSRSTTPPDAPTIEPVDLLHVSTPGDLVATLPSQIGFHPADSLVLVSFRGESGRRVGLVVRVDLPPPERFADLSAVAAAALLRDSPAGAAAIVVASERRPEHEELAVEVGRILAAKGVSVLPPIWATGTRPGARWAGFSGEAGAGIVPERTSTAAMAAAVVSGTVVHAGRAELEAGVAPVAHRRLHRRRELLIRRIDELAAGPDPGMGEVAAGLAAIDAAILEMSTGQLVLDDERVVGLACALAMLEVRDTALLRCIAPLPVAAEQLWLALTRETPDPEAAEPAALLAVSALLRGDGALANVALDRAQRSWPGHRLAELLAVAAQQGMPPAAVRTWLMEST